MSDSVRQLNANSIVDFGESEGIYYRKYADGILEQWGHFKDKVWIQNNNAAPYYSNAITITLPIASLTPCAVSFSAFSTGVVWPTGCSGNLKENIPLRMVATAPYNSGIDVQYSFRAIGTWK